jgi:diguanylate cyclase (GGDEF)-like protein
MKYKGANIINKKKIVYIPLVVGFFIILALSIMTFYFSRYMFYNQIKEDAIKYGTLLVQKIDGDLQHLESINMNVEEKLKLAGNTVINNKASISNEYLKEVSELFGVDELYWYNSSGEILFSSLSQYVGWKAEKKDSVYNFMISGNKIFMEDIRKSIKTGHYCKFGYLRSSDGSFVQVGYKADEIEKLTSKFSYQSLVENIAKNNDNILYALIIDDTLTAIADSDVEDIGVEYSENEEYQKALKGQVSFIKWYYPKIGKDVFEVTIPLITKNEIKGALAIGLSMDNSKKSMLVISIQAFVLVIAMTIIFLWFQIRNIIKPINLMSKHIKAIEDKSNELYQLPIEENSNFKGLYLVINELLKKIERLAYNDYLTDLPNRISFFEKLEKQVNSKKNLAIMLLDLNDFKAVNDTRGHLFGDKLLKSVSTALLEVSNQYTYISRFGGDEFLLIVSSDSKILINNAAYNIINRFEKEFLVDGEKVNIGASMGISLYPKDDEKIQGLISKADMAMYAAKHKQANNYVFYSEEMLNNILEKEEIEKILRSAIKNHGFKLVYQPLVDTFSGEIVAFEALIRLKEQSISPDKFIKVAEEKNLINKIGRWVIKEAISQLAQWKEKNIKIKPISVNVSVKQMKDEGLISYIQQLLMEFDVSSKYIYFEITESLLIEDENKANEFMNKLKSIGTKIAIDDFGSGYTSIQYLKMFPVDIIKFDKALIDEYLNVENKQVVISLIMLANEFKLYVVAEGVETYEQYEILKELKCQCIQGYLFSKPVEKNVVESIINCNYLNKSSS